MKPTTSVCFLAFYIGILFPGPMGFSEEAVTPETLLDYSLKLLEPLEKLAPQSSEIWIARGYVYHRSEKYPEAIEAFTKGLAINPNNAVVTEMAAFLYAKLNQNDKAVEWYKKTLQLTPDNPMANLRYGLALVQLKRMDEARQAFEKEIQYHPDDAYAHIYLGERYFDEKRWDDAKTQAESAIKIRPALPEPYYLLSRIYRQQGKEEESKQMLELFRQKKKEENDSLSQLPIISDLDQAKKSAAMTHFDAATIYYNTGNQSQAESNFLKALSLDPKHEMARYRLAYLYQETGKPEKAESLMRELVILNPNDYRYPLNLGMVLGARKNWDESETYLEKALTLNPESPEAKAGLARVFLNKNQNTSRALELMESVIGKEPTASNYDLLSWAYYVNGNAAACLEAIRAAIALDPNNPDYRQRYNKLLSKLNQ